MNAVKMTTGENIHTWRLYMPQTTRFSLCAVDAALMNHTGITDRYITMITLLSCLLL